MPTSPLTLPIAELMYLSIVHAKVEPEYPLMVPKLVVPEDLCRTWV
jgi:hypothetical protein